MPAASGISIAQQPQATPPDAKPSALSDTLEAGEAGTEAPRRTLVRWNEYERPFFTIRFGGAVLYDDAGYFSQISPARTVVRGGPGAWELLARFSCIDLDGGTLGGGRFWRFTPMVNWYPSDHMRLELAYGVGR
jgi:hypothetical protein